LKYYILIVCTIVLNAASQLLLKTGASRLEKFDFQSTNLVKYGFDAISNIYILLGLLTMTISMVTHLLSLSRFDVSFVFPFISFAYVIVVVWGVVFLGEQVNFMRYAGIFVILVGTVMLAMSGR